MTMIHPAHAMLLATTRHRELVAEAAQFRAARALAATARAGTPPRDCRVPSPAAQQPQPQPQPCRPDPRQAAASQPASRRPGFALRGHRKPPALR
jgi:hypothetical protein